MFKLMGKDLYPEKMEILYDRPFSKESLEEDFVIKSGDWHVDEEGWLIGKNPENKACMVISKKDFLGDVLLEVEASTILPCTRDINVMWHGSWNAETNRRHVAYVAGMEGWWNGNIGFEKSPKYDLVCATNLFPFEPGRIYHIMVGDIKGHIFVVVDGKVCLEIMDPDPIDNLPYGKIGFEAFCSYLRFRNPKVRRITYDKVTCHYDPEF